MISSTTADTVDLLLWRLLSIMSSHRCGRTAFITQREVRDSPPRLGVRISISWYRIGIYSIVRKVLVRWRCSFFCCRFWMSPQLKFFSTYIWYQCFKYYFPSIFRKRVVLMKSLSKYCVQYVCYKLNEHNSFRQLPPVQSSSSI